MPTEDNTALIRCWFEESYNQGKVPVADELIAANYGNHSAPHDRRPAFMAKSDTSLRSAPPSPISISPLRIRSPKGTRQ